MPAPREASPPELDIAGVLAAAAADAALPSPIDDAPIDDAPIDDAPIDDANAPIVAQAPIDSASALADAESPANAPVAVPIPTPPPPAPAPARNVLDAPRPVEDRPPAALMPAELPQAPVIAANPSRAIPPWVGVVAVLVIVAIAIGGYLASRPPPPPVIPTTPVAPPVRALPDAGPPDAPAPDRSAEELAALLVELESVRDSRDYPRMQSLAEAALAIDERLTPPTHPAIAAHLLSVALFRQHHAEEALPWAERAIEWDPEEGESRLLLGDLLAYRGSFPRARRVFQECVDEIPLYRPCRRRLDEAR